MSRSRPIVTAFALAIALVAGIAGSEADAQGKGNAPSGSGTLPPPLVSIVIYDGASLPADTIVACSELDCLGASLPPEQWTWEVTEPKNYVGWSVSGGDSRGRIYLYVDGKAVASARPGRLLIWSTTGLGSGTQHTVQALAYNQDGTPGWSTPVTVTVTH
jgi:hypothetical protein